MNRKELVKKAIHMDKPEYAPIFLYNKDQKDSDMVVIEVVKHWMGVNKDISEWGFRWEKHDNTMGQPKESFIKTWDDFGALRIPDPYSECRFEGVDETMKQYGDKYYLASLALSGFTVMTFLRGFTETLEDLYFGRENVEKLADAVFGFEDKVIEQLKGNGFDGVAFFDDWGTQTNLIISPQLWREFFKPIYKRQFDLAHKHGLDVYFHCCGYIYDIIPDLIEIGVDMLNLSQPNIFDLEKLGKDFEGKVCFVCPISYQTTSLLGSKEDIYAEAKKLIDNLGSGNGGFIGYVEEYHSIGLSEENYQNCINAFKEFGTCNY